MKHLLLTIILFITCHYINAQFSIMVGDLNIDATKYDNRNITWKVEGAKYFNRLALATDIRYTAIGSQLLPENSTYYSLNTSIKYRIFDGFYTIEPLILGGWNLKIHDIYYGYGIRNNFRIMDIAFISIDIEEFNRNTGKEWYFMMGITLKGKITRRKTNRFY